MTGRSAGVAAFAIVMATAGSALSQEAPATATNGERLHAAALEFDAGRRAYLERRYEDASIHFENAYNDAPRREALRSAIRSRREAGQLARAATLARLAERSYDDEETATLVRETLADATAKLHELTVRCSPACRVAIDAHAVALRADAETRAFVEPGPHDVLVTWDGERVARFSIEGRAGGSEERALEAPPPPPGAPAAGNREQPSPASPDEPRKPLSPIVFIAAAGVTGALATITVVSAVDAANDPGRDAVRRDCVGLGDSCPTYQRALDAQLRTNVLLGATVLAAATTVVIGAFFTDWSRSRRRAAITPVIAGTPNAAFFGVSGSL
jgi:hypothetical protein